MKFINNNLQSMIKLIDSKSNAKVLGDKLAYYAAWSILMLSVLQAIRVQHMDTLFRQVTWVLCATAFAMSVRVIWNIRRGN